MNKRLLLLLISLLTFSFVTAQEEKKQDTVDIDNFNRWSIELLAGQSKGVRPYSEGYFSSTPETLFGSIDINAFNVGVRYMISPKWGLKLDFQYDRLRNTSSLSLPFEMRQYRIGFQGVINAVRLFDSEASAQKYRWGLLLHGGIQASKMTSKTRDIIIGSDHNYNESEFNGGLIFGFSPQYRITNSIAILADVSIQNNYRQHYNWDGASSDRNTNLSGQLSTLSLGISFSLGDKNYGDWGIIKNETNEKELDSLNIRIAELEIMMNDTDKDGVPDYLDLENNTMNGVAVDTKGRAIDLNNNSIPDELESYIQKTYGDRPAINVANTTDSQLVKALINDGYVTTYFDFNKSTPTNVSTEGIDFILTYLRNNPSASVDIIGHADEIGRSAYNDRLAAARANNVKNILVKAKIDPSRLNVLQEGEDASVDNDVAARKLVRRVTFRVK